MSNAFQSGQECFGNTRAGTLLGYGVDVTLNMTEGLVDKVLPEIEEECGEGMLLLINVTYSHEVT